MSGTIKHMPERPGPPASVIDHPPTSPASGAENPLEMPHHVVTPETVTASVQEAPVKKEEAASLFPIQKEKENIIAKLRAHNTLLLEGQTGSGKSSFAPGYVLEARLQQDPNARVIVTQPRRIAVEETYKRVKGIVGEEHVAFHHGKGKAGPENAKITIMPDASLTNEIKRNPTLAGIAAVVVDEAHEEGTDMIVNMGLLKKIQRDRAGTDHPLKIVYTTATFDKDKHKKFNPDAAEVEVPGRTFEVDKRFIDAPLLISDDPVEDAEIKQRIFDGIRRDEKGGISLHDMPIVAARVANEVLKYRKDGGDPVIILPGRAEIKAAEAEFQKINPGQEYAILMGGHKDADAFAKMHHEKGRRIVFFASEVVEASVTIDTTDVIDGGVSRKPYIDPKTGLSTLRTVLEAKANNNQRVGRAGRMRQGWSITLLPQEVMEQQPEHLPSDMMRADLTGMILKLKAHGFQNIHEFDFIDKPDTDTINIALQKLYQLGAIDDEGKITKDIGEEMARIPLEPHLARMLVEAKRLGCVEDMEVIMGFLSSTKSLFPRLGKDEVFTEKYRDFVVEGSDILTQAAVWNDFLAQGEDGKKIVEWAREHQINLDGLYDVRSIKNDLSGKDDMEREGMKVEDKPVDIAGKKDAIMQAIIAGLGDRLLFRAGRTYSLVDGKKRGIILSNTSVVTSPEFVVSGNIRPNEKSGNTYAEQNQVVPKEIYDAMVKRIENTPKGILLDRKEDPVAPLTEKDATVAVAAAEEIVRPLTEEDAEKAVEEAEAIAVEKKQEEVAKESLFRKITAPIRWVGRDVQALIGGIWKSIKWLVGAK